MHRVTPWEKGEKIQCLKLTFDLDSFLADNKGTHP